MKFEPGDKVLVSYDLGSTPGEIVRDDGFGWWIVKQPYMDSFIEVQCAEEFIVREGEPPAPTPLQRMFAALR